MDAKERKEFEETVNMTMKAAFKAMSYMIDELMTPDMAKKVAVYQHEYFVNLKNQGFTVDQAMMLVSTTGISGIMNSLKK